MNMRIALAGVTAAFILAPAAASAGVVYENSANTVTGDCSFSTTCAAAVGRGNDYAAQRFVLSADATIESASFSIFHNGVIGDSANWKFYLADGDGSLPGTLVAEGSSAILGSEDVGSGFGLTVSKTFFDLPTVNLSAGSYYFAIQSVSPAFENFLSQGAASSGAAETFNGGATWQASYQGLPSVAVALYDTDYGAGAVPEPATWALMIVGFGGAGATLRRRRTAVA